MGGFLATNLVTWPDSGATRVPANGAVVDSDDTITFMSLDTSTWLCTGYVGPSNP